MLATPQCSTHFPRVARLSLSTALLTLCTTAASVAVDFLYFEVSALSLLDQPLLDQPLLDQPLLDQDQLLLKQNQPRYPLKGMASERVKPSKGSRPDVQMTLGGEHEQVNPTQENSADVQMTLGGERDRTPLDSTQQRDPIDSPHPLPWNWILELQSRLMSDATPQMYYYRSPALVSPDGVHRTYTRMQVQRVADPNQTQVSSLLFLENTKTGVIQFLTATSPQMQHILLQGTNSQQPGMLSMLMPISWSESGDRVLVRAFESIFSTDIAADYAIVWYQASNQVEHVVPTSADYSNAVLLGWSQSYPNQVLFRVGNLGDESWPLMSMTEAGDYQMVGADEAITYGQVTMTFWNGVQTSAIE